MPLLDKLEERKCVETVWGKLIPEKEAYEYATRQIAAFCAGLNIIWKTAGNLKRITCTSSRVNSSPAGQW